MPKKLVAICLSNFLIAALMGLLLRFVSIFPLSINYRFFTHAHSHTAMLGWVYLMLYLLIFHYFVQEKKTIYIRLFWTTQVAVWGMMFSFPFQGYAAISITFSTLHIICSYIFIFLIWKKLKAKSYVSSVLLKTALIFMAVSTLGVWCLGPAVGLYGNTSDFYQVAIQFFLHFQFNGWFLFAVIGVSFHILNIQDSKQFRIFYRILLQATVLTFALSLYWYFPYKLFYWLNALGVIFQITALFIFLKIIKFSFHTILAKASKLEIYLYSFSILCFCLKAVLQLGSLFPKFSQIIYQHKLYVIGFIHLLMLGVITGFLFAFMMRNKLITLSVVTSVGVYSFIIGFVLTEFLLLVQGYLYYTNEPIISNFNMFLFIASIFLPLGIMFLLKNLITQKSHAT